MALPSPPKSLTTVEADLRTAIFSALVSEPKIPDGWEWAEKLRRFVGVYRQQLGRVTRERFGAEHAAMLGWIAEILVAASAHSSRRGDFPCDLVFLNAALAVVDDAPAVRREQPRLAQQIEASLETVKAWHGAGNKRPFMPLAVPPMTFEAGRWKGEANRPLRMIVFSPNPYSLLTLSVLEIFDRLSCSIAGLVVRKFTTQRLVSEYRRDGARLIHKIWRKLIIRDENPDQGHVSLRKVLEATAPARDNAVQWCKHRGIPVFPAGDFNTGSLRAWLRQQRADIGIFTGGGLVSPETQAAFRVGIINPHMGHLPHFRGMDVVEWSLLEGRIDNVGATAHLMDADLDTGPTLQYVQINPVRYRTLGGLRNAVSGLMPFLLVDTALGLASGRVKPVAQDRVDPLYYYCDDKLLRIVTDRLRSGYDPSVSDVDSTSLFDFYLSEILSLERKPGEAACCG